jgi:S-adenosylmethionine-diacylglycerol 3-amino-3-carboxypropyl transferase
LILPQTSIKKAVFKRIHGHNLVYNTCWEDPRCDRALLQLDANSRVVMITSAGCNALDYLLDNPAKIHCVDMNPRQNAVLDLKRALIQKAAHDELFAFFGDGRSARAKSVLHDALLPAMSADAQAYWQRNIGFFSGKGLRNSFYAHGTAGIIAFSIRKLLEVRPDVRKAVWNLLECEDRAMQRVQYLRIEPFMLNSMMTWLMNRHVVQSMLGIPEPQQHLVRTAYNDGLAGYLRACFRHVFIELPFQDNYFWRLYMLGHYERHCAPNYLRPENYGTLRERADRIQLHTTTITQFLRDNPGQYTHFVLLDHQDWLAAHDHAALREEWDAILQNAAPNAKVLLRSATHQLDFLPKGLGANITFDTTPNLQEQHRLDRVGTYASVHVGTINNTATNHAYA